MKQESRQKSEQRRQQLRTQLSGLVAAAEAIGEILAPVRRGRAVHRNVSPNGHGPEFVYVSPGESLKGVYNHNGKIYSIEITKIQKQ